MADAYIVRFPDGAEYGPADLATLRTWQRDGRIPDGTLVQEEGSGSWRPLADVLRGPATARSASGAVPASPAASPRGAAATSRPGPADREAGLPRPGGGPTRPTSPGRPARPAATDRPPGAAATAAPSASADRAARSAARDTLQPESAPAPSGLPRAALLVAGGVLVVVALLGVLYAALSPWIARRRAMLDVERQALPDRRFADPTLGLTLELPRGWLILRPDTQLVRRSEAKLILAQPAIGAFAALETASRPRLVAGEDVLLDDLVDGWRVYRLNLQVLERGDLRLAKGQARVLRLSWEEAGEPMSGSAVAFHDGWNYFTLDAWAPARRVAALASGLQALARGTSTAGTLEGRVEEAVRRVAVEAPELSLTAVRLLVQVRMSAGAPTDDLPEISPRVVSRGLPALSSAETEEMRGIYAQVWGPLPEAERLRLARYLEQVRAGRAVPPEEAQPLRQLVKAGVLSLPGEAQARLQALNEKAIVASLGGP